MPTGWRGFGKEAVGFGGFLVFGKSLGVLFPGNLGGGGFAEHGEDEFIADGDAAQAFFDPLFRVAFLLIDRPHALGGEFGVFDFFEAFVADFGEPALEGFGFG